MKTLKRGRIEILHNYHCERIATDKNQGSRWSSSYNSKQVETQILHFMVANHSTIQTQFINKDVPPKEGIYSRENEEVYPIIIIINESFDNVNLPSGVVCLRS